MNTLLIFFAFPIATIILAAVIQTLLRSPIAVAAVFFSIFLIITFAFFDANFLIATIVYTILAFLSAAIVKLIRKIIKRCFRHNNNDIDTDEESNENDDAAGADDSSCGRIANTSVTTTRGFNIGTRSNIYRYGRR